MQGVVLGVVTVVVCLCFCFDLIDVDGTCTLLAQVHSTLDYYSESAMTDRVVKHQSPDDSPIASPNTIQPPLSQRIKRSKYS